MPCAALRAGTERGNKTYPAHVGECGVVRPEDERRGVWMTPVFAFIVYRRVTTHTNVSTLSKFVHSHSVSARGLSAGLVAPLTVFGGGWEGRSEQASFPGWGPGWLPQRLSRVHYFSPWQWVQISRELAENIIGSLLLSLTGQPGHRGARFEGGK